jgi:hypothetical protein
MDTLLSAKQQRLYWKKRRKKLCFTFRQFWWSGGELLAISDNLPIAWGSGFDRDVTLLYTPTVPRNSSLKEYTKGMSV